MFHIYGRNLMRAGLIILLASVILILCGLILWNNSGRILRKRLRETYGEECCQFLRRGNHRKKDNRSAQETTAATNEKK